MKDLTLKKESLAEIKSDGQGIVLPIAKKPAPEVFSLYAPDLVCVSHLRWDFVYQRPQHLMSRCARERRIFFIEEPVFGNSSMRFDMRETESGVNVVVPHLPDGLRSEIAITAVMKEMT